MVLEDLCLGRAPQCLKVRYEASGMYKNADIREKITINVCFVEIPDREEKVVHS